MIGRIMPLREKNLLTVTRPILSDN